MQQGVNAMCSGAPSSGLASLDHLLPAGEKRQGGTAGAPLPGGESDCLELEDRKGLRNEDLLRNPPRPSLHESGLVSGRNLAQATVRAWEFRAAGPRSPTIFEIIGVSGLAAIALLVRSNRTQIQVIRVARAKSEPGEGAADS